ncbi:PREDICTED: heterogeneous nuclear ribonucleoprotein 1-like [Nelumbo nucifera]|uniref:Heterogeneous nuclear ribonucleoprotein 1-like n=1 Tax=Nelumbo nucifera TaxID=4432 RepID=A0A1U8Q7C2_NELNU|nr:PREDICTED: heterogeneous nuclear ribonucleoprotein 1-like [Nelumbo nucifera]
MKDRNIEQPRDFGFITYADPSVKIIEETHVINVKQLEIKRTIPKGSVQSKDFKRKKIFVGGVSTIVAKDKFKMFSKHGKVVDHQIIRDHAINHSRGFGFIIFDNEQVVDDMLAKGNMIDLSEKQEREVCVLRPLEISSGSDVARRRQKTDSRLPSKIERREVPLFVSVSRAKAEPDSREIEIANPPKAATGGSVTSSVFAVQTRRD